ncbi:hypothetical protein T492DRAFT_919107 [Pavlovales sp. CCMP2436]|nr:hypothetical protein T492DRAFT_919107 [Pavlovales sp. CCMP2436]
MQAGSVATPGTAVANGDGTPSRTLGMAGAAAANGEGKPSRTVEERISALTHLLAKLDDHAAKLAHERARVAVELDKLLSKVNLHPVEGAGAQPAGAGAKAEAAKSKDARGKCAAMCIEEIELVASNWSSSVAGVALGEGCAMMLFDSAPPVFTSQFARQCPQLARQLAQRTAQMAPIAFIAIGSHQRFYVRFADGKQEWVGPDECTVDVKAKPVAQVGPDECIVDCDGTWEMGGCSDALADKVDEIVKSGISVKLINFGGNDSWLIRYNKPSVVKQKPAVK